MILVNITTTDTNISGERLVKISVDDLAVQEFNDTKKAVFLLKNIKLTTLVTRGSNQYVAIFNDVYNEIYHLKPTYKPDGINETPFLSIDGQTFATTLDLYNYVESLIALT